MDHEFYLLPTHTQGRVHNLFILQAIFNTALQVTDETDLLNSSQTVLSVYDGNPVQIYPKHEIHDIIPEGKKSRNSREVSNITGKHQKENTHNFINDARDSSIKKYNYTTYSPYGANIGIYNCISF